jgi:hypothetical protein
MAHLFGLGHLVLRSGGVAYVARCGMVVVELRNQTTCTQEIPVTYQGKEMYVDPFSLVIQHSATPVKCRRKTPSRWRIGKEWICGYPEIQSCNGPGPLPGHRYRERLKVTGTAGSNLKGETDEVQSGADEGREAPQETLDALATDISNHWIEGYGNLGSIPAVVGTAVMGVSDGEMVMSTIVRMMVLYAQKVPGPWMVTVFWGTAFQIAIMPARWALEWGECQGKAVSQAILARVGGANLPADGGGTASIN